MFHDHIPDKPESDFSLKSSMDKKHNQTWDYNTYFSCNTLWIKA